MKLITTIVTTGAIAAALVVAGSGAADAATTTAPTPKIDTVYSGTDQAPIGSSGNTLTTYVNAGRVLIGGGVDSLRKPERVKLVNNSGAAYCTTTDLSDVGNSYGFGCTVNFPAGTYNLRAVSVLDGKQSAPSRAIKVVVYGADAASTPAPAATPAPVAAAAVAAPKVSFIERIGFTQISLLLQGEDTPGAEFAVTFNGQTQRLQASHGQSFVMLKGITVSQDNVVSVTQVVNGKESAATKYTYKIG